MGLFGIGVYEPVNVAPPGSIASQLIATSTSGGIPGVNTLLYTTAVKNDRPLAYYMLADGQNGDNPDDGDDSSGNWKTAALFNASDMTFGVPGPLQGPGESALTALTLGGASYLGIPSSLNIGGWTRFTVELLVNLPSILTGNPRILANSHTDIDHQGVQFGVFGAGRLVTFTLGNGSSFQTVASLSPLPTGAWTYLTATWDGQTMTIYWNGVPQATSPFTGPIASSGHTLNIGRNPSYNGDFVTGSLAHVAIYNKCLSAADIAARNALIAPTPTTVYGTGFSTQPFQLQPPSSGIYGGPYGYVLYTNIRAPKSVQWTPAQSIGIDNLGNPVVRGFPQMIWSYSTLRPDYWYYLRQLYRLAGNAPPEYQYLVMIQYPDQSGQFAPIQQLARMEAPIHAYRTVGAYYGVQLKFTSIGQALLDAHIPIVTVV